MTAKFRCRQVYLLARTARSTNYSLPLRATGLEFELFQPAPHIGYGLRTQPSPALNDTDLN